jgi:hypothetical protein
MSRMSRDNSPKASADPDRRPPLSSPSPCRRAAARLTGLPVLAAGPGAAGPARPQRADVPTLPGYGSATSQRPARPIAVTTPARAHRHDRASSRADHPPLRAPGPLLSHSAHRADRRLGARLLRALRTVGNPDHGGAESGEFVFLCIASARRELPLLPRSGLVVGPRSAAADPCRG